MKAIESCEDVRAAVAEKPEDPVTRRHIIKQAIDHGCFDAIPDAWEIELESTEEKDDGDGTEAGRHKQA